MRFTGARILFAEFVLITSVTLAEELPTADDVLFFESKVRPLLVSKCHECHSALKPKSGLRLDSREAILVGGESGPAAIAGKPDESLLIDVIGYRNSIQMPPKAKLADAEIAVMTEWVRRGLPWPDSVPTVSSVPSNDRSMEFTEEQKSFWAFQPVKRLQAPYVRQPAWSRSPIDRFILAELENKNLTPAPMADRNSLVRRVSVDLIGLLPTPEEVSQFLEDSSPDAFERAVDRLLASPRYGERWARHWLDVARYADSNGLDENLAYANAYRYRDYVVRAMNEDKPFDRFLIEQIAGDLLNSQPDAAEIDPSNRSQFDPLIATGFLSLGAKMLAEDDPVKMQMDIIDEQVDTIARTFMGLTMGCARCHDHKFDPLTTEDYYGLAGIFKSTQTMDTFTVVARWHERPLASASQIKHRDELQQLATTQKQIVDKIKSDATEPILTEARRRVKDYLLAATWEMLTAERLKTAKPRGDDLGLETLPDVVLIEAEDYQRGNVTKDHNSYGTGIGVLVNRGETPNFVEYDVAVQQSNLYQLELRYAAAGSRPVKLFINGSLAKNDAAAKVTGSWTPESQTWFIEGIFSLNAGKNVIRLEQPQAFPHIDKLLLVPFRSNGEAADGLTSLGLDPNFPARTQLVKSLVHQWVKLLENSKDDENSILSSWHRFIAAKMHPLQTAKSDHATPRLLGEVPAASLVELAEQYEHLFSEAQQAWTDLKNTEAGRDAKSLSDDTLESARILINDSKGPFAVPEDIETLFSQETVAALKSGREELAKRETAVPKFPETMAVSELKPENLKIHLRGSHLTLGREVPHQLPRILAREDSRVLPNGSGRMELSSWLARRDHPLTSRVMANRIWQWNFGQGLVRSSDNFGRLGERPSHPALLDWLASEFIGKSDLDENTIDTADNANQSVSPRSWSMKSLHRRLVETAVYRQGTKNDPDAALADPENRLLWRSHRQRMDVEVLRDSLLALSGQLDEKQGGSLLPTPNRNYVTSTANVTPMIYGSPRRSIYLPVVRSALFEVFTAFDFADPSTPAGQRDQTTIAPQALFMMNSPFVLEQSRLLAGRLLERSGWNDAQRVRSLYELAYSRGASEGEVSRALGYLDQLKSAITQTSSVQENNIEMRIWTSLCRAVLSTNEFIYIE